MYRTFNCGVGLVVALPKDQADAAVELLKAEGENAWVIGEIANAEAGEEQVVSNKWYAHLLVNQWGPYGPHFCYLARRKP